MPLSFQVLLALLSDLGAELFPQLGHLRPYLFDQVHLGLLLFVVDLRAIEHVQIIDSLLQFLYLALPVEREDLLPPELLLHHEALLVPCDYF